ncbi:putative serine/threonine-protein kinase, partial [Sesbania bispinosa]
MNYVLSVGQSKMMCNKSKSLKRINSGKRTSHQGSIVTGADLDGNKSGRTE